MLNKFKKIACVLCSVLLILFATVPASAATVTIYDVKSTWGIEYDESVYPYYVLVQSNSNENNFYILLSSETNPCAWRVQNGWIYSSSGGSYYYYRTYFNDGVYSFGEGSYKNSSSCCRVSEYTIIDSNYDVYEAYSGDIFFQQPTLLRRLLSLVAPTLEPTTTQTVLTLVLCGVGLMALLVGLHLLPKVLAKFLH